MNIPNQNCPQCGASLPAGEMYCGNCGRHIDPRAGGQTQYASNSGYGQPIAPTVYAGPPYSNTPQYEYTSYGTPSETAAPPPPPGGYGTPGAVTYPSASGYPPPGGGMPPFPQAPQQKKGPGAGLIVGLVALVVIIVGGGLFWLLGSKGSGGVTQATPTVAQSTPASTPTAQALFSDNFTDNTNNWFIGTQGEYAISIGNGALKMKETNSGRLLYEEFPQQPPTDTTINVKFTFLNGGANDAMGLILRSNPSNNRHFGYLLSIYGDNSYEITRYHQDPNDATKGKSEYLLHRSTTALKPKGQQNQLSVTLKGSNINLTLNGKLITVATDTSNLFPDGSTLFFVETDTQSTGVEGGFNSVAVYPVS